MAFVTMTIGFVICSLPPLSTVDILVNLSHSNLWRTSNVFYCQVNKTFSRIAEFTLQTTRRFLPKRLPADSGEIPDFSEKVGDLGW
jgi:hypothetical protein